MSGLAVAAAAVLVAAAAVILAWLNNAPQLRRFAAECDRERAGAARQQQDPGTPGPPAGRQP